MVAELKDLVRKGIASDLDLFVLLQRANLENIW